MRGLSQKRVPLYGDPRTYQLFALVWFGVATFVLISIWEPGGAHVTTPLLPILLLGGAITAVCALRWGRADADPLDPLALYSAIFGLYFVIHAIWLVSIGPTSSFTLKLRRPFFDSLGPSQWMLLFAYLALVAGFLLAAGKSERRMIKLPTRVGRAERVSFGVLAVMFAVGMGSNLLGRRSAGEGATNVSLFYGGGQLALIAYIVTIYRAEAATGVTRLRLQLAAYGVMLPIQAVWWLGIGRGSRSDFLVVMLTTLAVRAYHMRRLKFRTVVLAGIVLLFVISPILSELRGYTLKNGGDIGGAVAHYVRSPMRLVPNSRTPAFLGSGFEEVQSRTNGSESVALSYAYTPVLSPFRHGDQWLPALFSIIPHVVWPSKPTPHVGREFSEVYANQGGHLGFGQQVSPTVPGDLYVNFGYMGVIVGYVAIGLFIGTLTRIIRRRERPSAAVTLLAFGTVIRLLFMEKDVGGVISQVMTNMAVMAVGLAILTALAPRAVDRGQE